jgi:predicted DNA-binding transcriptional regulator AlpA
VLNDDLDPFMKWGPICQALGGISRRTLYDMEQRGDFPPPDRPARRRGEADLWRKSTVRRALDKYASGSKEQAA